MNRTFVGTLLLAALWSAAPVLGEPLDKAALTKLVTDQTWHVNWAACMGGSNGCRTYWDFKGDGTMCPRMIGATRKDKCADDGKWHVDGSSLCWQLTWLGGGEGYKKVCVSIDQAGDNAYVAKRVGGIGVKFFELSLVK